jgi:hypothetical protein
VNSSAKLHGAHVPVELSCSADSTGCSGTLTLTQQARRRVRKHGHTRLLITITVLGHIAYKLSAGQTKTLSVPLTKLARTSLAHARHHRLSVTAIASRSDGGWPRIRRSS